MPGCSASRASSHKDSAKIISGLKSIAKEIEAGKFKFSQELEDIHTDIEAVLSAKK